MTTSKKDYDSSILIDINERSAQVLIDTVAIPATNPLSYVVTEPMYHVLQVAHKIATITKGAFDPTVAPLVNAWGFGNTQPQRPNRDYIASLLPLVDYSTLYLDVDDVADPSSVSRATFLPPSFPPSLIGDKRQRISMMAGQQVDVGGIAKGYAADRAVEILRTAGVQSALIDFGGNIYAMGSKVDGSMWNIGVQSPFDSVGTLVGTVSVTDTSVVTSGTYERFFVEDDIAYHHLLDPDTGWQVDNELLSATVISPNSTEADALSTGVFVMGLIEGMALIETLGHAEAIFIDKERRVYVSSGIEEHFQITDTRYRVSHLPIK